MPIFSNTLMLPIFSVSTVAKALWASKTSNPTRSISLAASVAYPIPHESLRNT